MLDNKSNVQNMNSSVELVWKVFECWNDGATLDVLFCRVAASSAYFYIEFIFDLVCSA